MFKSGLYTAIIILFISSGISQPLSARRSLSISDFYQIKTAKTPRISPDGKWVLYAVSEIDSASNSYRSQIWMVAVAGGTAEQVTRIGTSSHSPAWSPDGREIVFVSNAESGSQLWLMNRLTREAQRLTDLPQGAWSPVWSPTGKKIAFLSETKFDGRNPPGLYDIKVFTHLRYRWWYDDNRYDEGWRSHIFIYDLATKEIRQLTDGDWFDDEICYSPDGEQIAFVSNRTADRENNIDTDIWIVDVETGVVEKAFENTGPDYSPSWSPDGKYLAWRSTFRYNYESDNYDIMVKDWRKNQIENLTEHYDRVIYDLNWHPDGKEIVFLAGDQGDYNLYAISRSKKKIDPIAEGRHRIRQWSISRDGKTLVMARSKINMPDEIYVVPYRQKTVQRISEVNDRLLDQVLLVEAVMVNFEGDGGVPIQGWYLLPPDFDTSKRYPLILNIHGGPQLMYSNQFDFEFQLTAASGYVVFYCNPRGSLGYGQAFTDEINQDYGGSCYRDIMAGIDHMISLGFVDAHRMGVTGLSFGGWMTTWIIGHTDRFKAAVPMAPFVNMFSFYGTTDEQFFPEWDFGGPPYDPESRAIYEKNSPLNYATNFKTPTLILHGEADWRCHITEGEQLFTALKKMGVPAVMARFPNEPHVFEQPNHIEAALRLKLEWWQKYLTNEP